MKELFDNYIKSAFGDNQLHKHQTRELYLAFLAGSFKTIHRILNDAQDLSDDESVIYLEKLIEEIKSEAMLANNQR